MTVPSQRPHHATFYKSEIRIIVKILKRLSNNGVIFCMSKCINKNTQKAIKNLRC